MTHGAARAFATRMNSQPAKSGEVVTDPLAIAFMRRLEARGIGKYLDDEPVEVDGRQALRDLAEWNRNLPTYEAELKARREAQTEAERQAALTPAQRLAEALRGAAEPSPEGYIPLNGAGVLKAVLSGLGGGTVDGKPA